MYGTLLFFAVAAVGVDYGWQPLPDGGLEYLIQIEPELLDTVKRDGIASDIPPRLRDVRSYRITIGRKKLPRIGNPKPASNTKQTPPPKSSASPSDAATEKTPARLHPSPYSKPLGEKSAAFLQEIAGDKKKAPLPSDNPKPTKPWLVFWLIVGCLGGSIGANLYLGWITWDTRSRYRTLLSKWLSRSSDGPSPIDSPPTDGLG